MDKLNKILSDFDQKTQQEKAEKEEKERLREEALQNDLDAALPVLRDLALPCVKEHVTAIKAAGHDAEEIDNLGERQPSIGMIFKPKATLVTTTLTLSYSRHSDGLRLSAGRSFKTPTGSGGGVLPGKTPFVHEATEANIKEIIERFVEDALRQVELSRK